MSERWAEGQARKFRELYLLTIALAAAQKASKGDLKQACDFAEEALVMLLNEAEKRGRVSGG